MSDPNDYAFPERFEMPFSVGKRQYILKEAGGYAAKRYKVALMKAGKMRGEELVDFNAESIIDRDYQLLADCCYTKQPGENIILTKPVSLEEVLAWGEKVCRKLIDKCKEISDLNEVGGIEGIDRQIALLQQQRTKLAVNGTPGELAKNGQSSGETSSVSPTSSVNPSTESLPSTGG